MFFLTVAWRNLLRQGRRSVITASGMALGIALCMALIAFADGMYAQMEDVLIGQSLGHVQVHHPAYPGSKLLQDTVPDGGALIEALEATPEVQAVTGRVFGWGLAAAGDNSTGVRLVGIDPTREDRVSGLADRLVDGAYLPDDAELGALIGTGLAKTLEVGVGDEVVLITQAADGSLGNELATVSGVFQTGRAALDKGGLFLHIEDAQSLLALPGQVHEVLVIGPDADTSAVSALAAGVRSAASPDALVRTWFETDPQIAQMMGMQDVSMLIVVVIVLSVAALAVLNTMLMSVFERTREFGLLRALGLTPWQLVRLVMLESLMLGLMACVAGGVFGGVLDWMLVNWGLDLSMGSSSEGFESMGITFDPVIKGEVRLQGVALTISTVFVVSMIAALWPALIAARLKPVDAMRQV